MQHVDIVDPDQHWKSDRRASFTADKSLLLCFTDKLTVYLKMASGKILMKSVKQWNYLFLFEHHTESKSISQKFRNSTYFSFIDCFRVFVFGQTMKNLHTVE